MNRTSLPVDAIVPAVLASLQQHTNLVIEAAPGAGKTTRVPPALLQSVSGDVIVLEPRRIAARLAARRVAEELGEETGETVGYQIRFEERVGPRTRLRFVTEGVLTRRMLSDPLLKGVEAVVLDEFHERHLDTDLALALLRRLQGQRPELKLIVMSATLNAGPVRQFLGDCPLLRSEGRVFPLEVEHLPYSPEPLEKQIKRVAELLLNRGETGHMLIFLPGAAEIRRAIRECEPLTQRHGVMLLPLHGDLSPAEQDRAVGPSRQQKLIFATNVAESSVTVEGVTAVIDSGMARVATYSPWTGLPTLQVTRISKASAKQRAGRAGRTGPGRVLRLYPEEDFALRPDHDVPEMMRNDLSQLALALRAMEFPTSNALRWLDEPAPAAVEHAELLLERLGATGDRARRMARFPLPPRLSRMLLEAVERGAGEKGCRAAALLSAGTRSTAGDLLAALDAPLEGRVQQQAQQLRRIARVGDGRTQDEDALLISMLAGFPDRVARRRSGTQLLLSSGGSAEIAGEPPLYEFMVALEVEDRKDKPLPLVRMTARIEPEWLLDFFPEHVREESSVEWNRGAERVEAVSALRYGDLVIQESRGSLPDPEQAAALLGEKALEHGLDRFVDTGALEQFLARTQFAGLPEPDLAGSLRELCIGLRSFAELRVAAKTLIPLLEQSPAFRDMCELAPTSLRLPSGRQTAVHYERGKPPWIASRLQDFFGMRDTPRIGRERIPVVVHLLAPNQRPVQTTSDLQGFWERLYPQVRRELARRYPRHAWPEKP